MLSGYLGADYRFAPNALAGLAASYSSLDLTSTSEVEGKATLTGSLDGGDAGYRFGFGGSLEYREAEKCTEFRDCPECPAMVTVP